MRLKHQITLLTSASLIVPALLIGTVSIYRIQKKTNADIEEYRKLELDKLKHYLQHITDVGYGMLELDHNRGLHGQIGSNKI
jgi:hypothetical protein